MSKRRRINLRQTPRVSYYEPDEPNLDEYVFCSECGDYVYEYCSIHGPLLVIPDDKIRDANNRPSHVVDATDPNSSNWMRYVNCSRHWLEQNLVAYQYRGQIYYRTIKIIPRFTELMVFYGSEFAYELGIDLKKYNSPSTYAQKLVTQKIIKHHNNTQIGTESEECPNIQNIKDVEKVEICQEATEKHLEKNYVQNTVQTIYSDNLHSSKPTDKVNSLTAKCSIDDKDLNNNFSRSKSVSCINKLSLDSGLYQSIQRCKNYFIRNVVTKYTCDICLFVTHRRISLENHLLLHANVKGIVIFKCKYCLHVSKTARSIKNHELSHTGEKPYTCDLCQRKFTESGALRVHKRTHTGEKPYTCSVCQRKFTKSSNLERHKRYHTGEKPYTCDVCQRKFSQSSDLERHKRTHTGEKPYTCSVCQRKFSRSDVLERHKRYHTGEKPYTCDVCQRKFTESGALERHKRYHTGEKPYTCDVCQRKFSQSSDLERHKRTHKARNRTPVMCVNVNSLKVVI